MTSGGNLNPATLSRATGRTGSHGDVSPLQPRSTTAQARTARFGARFALNATEPSELSRKVSSPESVDDRPELKIAARAVSGMFALFVRLHGADVDSVHAVTMYALGDES